MAAVRNQQTLENICRFLEENAGDKTAAFKKAGVSYGFVRQWERDDPKAEEAIKQALEAGTAVIESAVIKRAVKGVKEPIYYKDELIGHRRKYSDGLAEFLLRSRNPGVYGNKIDVNKTITVRTLSDAELDKRIEDFSTRLGLTYQPIDAEFVEVGVEEAEFAEIGLDDLL